MKRTFLIGVATGALLAGANIASAQTMDRGGGSMERGGAAAEQRGHAGGEMNANSPAGNNRAQSQDKATTGQGEQRNAQDPKGDNKAQRNDNRAQENKAQENKAQDNRAQDNKAQNAQSNDAKGDAKSNTAQGNKAGGDTKVTLTTEQKTKIRETVIRSSNAPRVTNVNFSVSVGTVVPRTVRYAPLPPVLVEYYPAWRGYDYVIVEERVVVIEPGSLRIVAVLDV